MSPTQSKVKTMTYHFEFSAHSTISYQLKFNFDTMELIQKENLARPAWTKLEFCQCTNCPLKPKKTPFCPIAVNIAEVIELFKDKVSHEETTVTVETEERTYVKKVAIQEGMFGILGLIMVMSECPHTKFLKPMARFHLPFSTVEETMIRSVSMYLARQFFVKKKGGKPDWDLNQLKTHYEELKEVDLGTIKRIRSLTKKDAEVNGIIVLHVFANMITSGIARNLSELEKLFF